jgi:hypothetical protein
MKVHNGSQVLILRCRGIIVERGDYDTRQQFRNAIHNPSRFIHFIQYAMRSSYVEAMA